MQNSDFNDPMKKWANELNRAFSKEEAQMNTFDTLSIEE
jgi:hypothetical protein